MEPPPDGQRLQITLRPSEVRRVDVGGQYYSQELNERQRRLWAATEARAVGRGGIARVARATGMTRKRVAHGLRDLAELDRTPAGPADPQPPRVRRPGGGRKRLLAHDPELLRALEACIEPTMRGDPMSPLRWTCKSTAKLAAELTERGHPVSPRTVAALLQELQYSLQDSGRDGAPR